MFSKRLQRHRITAVLARAARSASLHRRGLHHR